MIPFKMQALKMCSCDLEVELGTTAITQLSIRAMQCHCATPRRFVKPAVLFPGLRHPVRGVYFRNKLQSIIHWCSECLPCKLLKKHTNKQNQAINQISIAPISLARPGLQYSRISVQQQNQWNSSVTSTGRRACLCLWGKGQVKEIVSSDVSWR